MKRQTLEDTRVMLQLGIEEDLIRVAIRESGADAEQIEAYLDKARLQEAATKAVELEERRGIDGRFGWSRGTRWFWDFVRRRLNRPAPAGAARAP